MATILDSSAATLRSVARLHVRAQRRLLAAEHGKSTTCTILTELGGGSAMTLAELSSRLKIDKGWVSRAVAQLADDGLLHKKAGAADRRTVVLSLTGTGRTEHRRLEALLDAQVRRIIGRIESSQRVVVHRVLQQLLASYRQELAR